MLKETKRNGTLTRVELRAAVYDCRPGLTRAEAQMLLDETLGEICAALIRGESVSLRSFGTFNVRAKRERIGRNPKNGVAATNLRAQGHIVPSLADPCRTREWRVAPGVARLTQAVVTATCGGAPIMA